MSLNNDIVPGSESQVHVLVLAHCLSACIITIFMKQMHFLESLHISVIRIGFNIPKEMGQAWALEKVRHVSDISLLNIVAMIKK